MSKLFKSLFAVGSAGVISATYLMHSTSESMWENISMPFIRLLDAEQAHRLAVKTASWGFIPKFVTKNEDREILVSILKVYRFPYYDRPIMLCN